MDIILPLSCTVSSRSSLRIEETDTHGRLIVDGTTGLQYQVNGDLIEVTEVAQELAPVALLGLLAGRFCRDSQAQRVSVRVPCNEQVGIQLVREGVFDTLQAATPSGVVLSCTRQTFWQHPALWLGTPASGHTALRYQLQAGKRHPIRPPIPEGEVYRRFIPGLQSTFSLRTVDIARDLEAFNRWMNLENVAYFWEQAGSAQEHTRYLQQMLDDPRVHPLIGCYDDEPFAYFEVYWCKEDRIAPFYDVQDHDRGWHVVIGESKHQGLGKLRGWFRSLMHYMFLDDPRTQRILGEPRIDHTRQIEFLKSQGYGHLKNIQLAHKEAALLRLERESFFDEHRL
ncbi:acetyltransferase [Pseudomonas silvicola]|nr:acetyltransferase [Pseudomonas silvicola]